MATEAAAAAGAAAAALRRVPIPPRGVDYRGKVVLAPMVRSGELPTRLLALHYGADLVWGPETIDRAMIGTTRHENAAFGTVDFTRPRSAGSTDESIIYRLHPGLESRRLIFQLGTADPDRAVAAARLVAGDVAGIDVNAGCPKPFSTSGGMGAALLKTPDKLVSILEALVRDITPEFQIGISVKIRLLETAAETEALVRRLVATGITGLTIHCRTTPMRPRERAIRGQLRMVGEVCREAGVACLMNGDVEDRDSAERLAAEFGVDGAMIATAAEKNPSCFRSKAAGGLAPWREMVEKYVGYALDVGNRWGNTKFLLGQMVPGKQLESRAVNQSKSYMDACDILKFDGLFAKAAEVDARIGTAERVAKSAQKSAGVSKKAKRKAEDELARGDAARRKQSEQSTSEPSTAADAGLNSLDVPGLAATAPAAFAPTGAPLPA